MNVLVLGGNGFVGKNVVQHLTQDKTLKVFEVSLSKGVDLRFEGNVLRAFEEFSPNFIVNCAAHVGSLNYVTQYAAEVISNNAQMILSLYSALSKYNKSAVVINPIANCAFPGVADIYKETEWQNGPIHESVLSYGNSRRFLWAVSECYKMQYGIRSINLFVPNMYGPHDSTDPNKAHALNALISKFTKAELNKENEITVWGTGKVIREWLYAPDFARVVGLIIQSKELQESLNKPMNIGQNWGLSISELANIINCNFNKSFEIKYDLSKPDGAPRKVMSDELFRRIFPSFEFTKFENGIKETVSYYKSVLSK